MYGDIYQMQYDLSEPEFVIDNGYGGLVRSNGKVVNRGDYFVHKLHLVVENNDGYGKIELVRDRGILSDA